MTRLLTLAGLLVTLTGAAAGSSTEDVGGCAGTVPERTLQGNPGTYLGLVATLGPGDLLQLAPGTYPDGLPLSGHAGEPDRCILIEGPASGPAAIFTGRNCCNTISLADASYLVIRNLELDGQGLAGDGVKAESTAAFVHHVTLESLYIHGHGADQQIVGINTKCPTWNWVVRGNVIEGAGTGMYFGDSNGEDEMAHSLIEGNLVVDTIGYNLQIKHQNGRAVGLGSPAAGVTILRHNVFSKANNGSSGGNARPNVLVGHRPPSGPGSDDDTLIYGNVFHQNPNEGLLQAEGHVIVYDNLLLNDDGAAVRIQPHQDVPKRVRVFHNTVVANGTTVSITGGDPSFEQHLVGNALFGNAPNGGTQADNTTDAYGAAAAYLTNPDGVLTGATDRLDFYPLIGTLDDTVDPTNITGYRDGDLDFNEMGRLLDFRGAYAGEGVNPGWLPALEIKPRPGLFADGFESGNTNCWSAASL